VEFLPPPGRQRRRNLFLTDIRRDQAPFHVFGDSLTSLTGSLRFGGGLASRRLDKALADDVLATYSDQSACLVVTPSGSGLLAVLNADLDASNLPSSPAFVPLVGELAGRLLGRQRAVDAVPCGEPFAFDLPAAAGSAAGLRIVGPGASPDPALAGGDEREADNGQLVEESGGVLWRGQALRMPGIYHIQRQGTPVFSVATAVAPEESDLRSLDPAVLQERLAGDRKVAYRAAAGADEERDDRWVWLASACVVCLLGELVALKVFRT
jgi:hypothetical protein